MLNLSKVFLLLCVCIASTSSQKYSFQDKEYFLIDKRKTFDEANTLCNSRNEQMVQIKSQDEQDFVYNSIVKQSGRVWLGATNVFSTKTFIWLGDASELTFSNWLSSQPDEDVNQRNGVVMTNSDWNGKWADNSVTNTFYVICEQKLKSFTYLDKEYFVTDQLKAFDEAVRICDYRNESLLQIKSGAENGFVHNTIVKPINQSIWLGATNIVGTRTFKWLDDSELDYSNWVAGHPYKDINQRNAIYVDPSDNGKWMDTSTNASYHVVCRKVSIYALKTSLLEQFKEFNGKVEQLEDQLTSVNEKATEQLTSKLEEQRNTLTVQQVALEKVTEQTLKQYKEKIDQLAVLLKAAENANEQLKMELEDAFNTKTTQLDVQLKAAIDSFNGEFTSKLKEQSNTLSAQQVAIKVVTEQCTAKRESFQPSPELEVKLNEQFKIELAKQRITLTAKQEALEKKLDNFIKWTESTPKIEW